MPERIRCGSPLNVYDRATFYCGGSEGYTDYPKDGEYSDRYDLIDQACIGVSLATAKEGGIIQRRTVRAEEERAIK